MAHRTRHARTLAALQTNLKSDAYYLASAFSTVFTHDTGPATLETLYSSRNTDGRLTHLGIDRTHPFSTLNETHKSMSIEDAAQIYTGFTEDIVTELQSHYPDVKPETWRCSLAVALPYALYHSSIENPEIRAEEWGREWLTACDAASGQSYSTLVDLNTEVLTRDNRTLILPERARCTPAGTTCCMALARHDRKNTQSRGACVNCPTLGPHDAHTVDLLLQQKGVRLRYPEQFRSSPAR